jgi:hypothetical protein
MSAMEQGRQHEAVQILRAAAAKLRQLGAPFGQVSRTLQDISDALERGATPKKAIGVSAPPPAATDQPGDR